MDSSRRMPTRAQKRNMRRWLARRRRAAETEADKTLLHDVYRSVLTAAQRSQYCVMHDNQVIKVRDTFSQLDDFIAGVPSKEKSGWLVYCPAAADGEIGIVYKLHQK